MKVVCLDNTKGNTRYLDVNKVYDTKELPGDRSHLLISEYYLIDFNRYSKLMFDRDNDKEVFIKSLWVSRKDRLVEKI